MRLHASVAFCLILMFQTPSRHEPITLVGSIELPAVAGRIDHLAFDPAAHRLFVAALGNNTVEVLDTKSNTHVKSLAGFREPQGIAVLPDATRLDPNASEPAPTLAFATRVSPHITAIRRIIGTRESGATHLPPSPSRMLAVGAAAVLLLVGGFLYLRARQSGRL